MKNPFARFELTGKTAVVTGGGTGLGYSMTRGLLRSGATVMISGRRESILIEAAEKLTAENWPGKVLYKTVDLKNSVNVDEFAKQASEALNGVDIYIGNAANTIFRDVEDIDLSSINEMFDVNVAANMILTKEFLVNMRKRKWGRIIYSSSGASIMGSVGQGHCIYAATKGAMDSFTRICAAEAGHDGITVNSIILGIYFTPMMENYLADIEEKSGKQAVKEFVDSYARMTFNGRIARSDELEGVIQFLASDAASNVTGTNLIADGGLAHMLTPNQPPINPIYPPEY